MHPSLNRAFLAIIPVVILSGSYFAMGNASEDQKAKPANGILEIAMGSTGTDPAHASAIIVTIARIEIENPEDGTWLPIMTDRKTLNLINLKSGDQATRLSSIPITARTYGRIRLIIDHVTIADAKGALVPTKSSSTQVIISGVISVKPHALTSLEVTAQIQDALHPAAKATRKRPTLVFNPSFRLTTQP
jgi:hypothetical protein